MTTNPTIRVEEPGELIASVPTLIGYTPARSLVTITLRARLLGMASRIDLPPESDYPRVAAHIAGAHARAEGDAVLAVIVDAEQRANLVVALRRALAVVNLQLLGAYQVEEFTTGARWCSLLDTTVAGALPDPASTAIAAALVARGRVTHASRHDVETMLEPDQGEDTAARAAAIDRLQSEQSWTTDALAGIVRTALRAALDGELPESDQELAELAIALTDPKVRDACMATAFPHDAALARAAASLWQALTRALPAPERAAPATLAGFAAYADGEGTLANIAFDIAVAADPGCTLAGLLQRALSFGTPPDRLRTLACVDDIGLLQLDDSRE